MKITTWNVNGIRAAMNKGLVEWVQDFKPDVLCLQEVKARPDQVVDAGRIMPGGMVFWNAAVQPGYSGVAVFTGQKPDQVDIGLDDERFDSEGRVLQLHFPEFTLFNVYFPNGQRGHDRVTYKLEFYEHLLKKCDKLHAEGRNIVITGDFNTAHREIDLANPKQNITTSGFLPEERVWIDHYLQKGFVDAFRILYPERIQYTWWTYRFNARARNIGWRLDYFLISSSMMPRVKDMIVHELVPGSDHCPVTLEIEDNPSTTI
jgi:exodeoxyribonuclease III